jgi:hypothetical protein
LNNRIKEALQILVALGVPKRQQNERTALCLLALADIKHNSQWAEAHDPLLGITPMMEFAKAIYKKEYVPNTRETFKKIGIFFNEHGKIPDCIFYHKPKNWLVLVESVTSHGPIDSKRRIELQKLFNTDLTIIYITAFPNRQTFTRFTAEIAWETEVWLSDNPTHLIHFNGDKFLG